MTTEHAASTTPGAPRAGAVATKSARAGRGSRSRRLTVALLVTVAVVLLGAAVPASAPPRNVPVHLAGAFFTLGSGTGVSLVVTATGAQSATLACTGAGLGAGQWLTLTLWGQAGPVGVDIPCTGDRAVINWADYDADVSRVTVAVDQTMARDPGHPGQGRAPGTRVATVAAVSFPLLAPGDAAPAPGQGPAWYRLWRQLQASGNRAQAALIGTYAAAYTTATGGRCWMVDGLHTCQGGWGHLYAMAGTTWGTTYVAGPGAQRLLPVVIRHEAVHQAQWQLYGALFAAAYLRAGTDHTTNQFERQAGGRF